MVDDLFMHDDDKKVIPTGMPLQILDYIHTGHLGLTKRRSRAPISVWWPHRLGELLVPSSFLSYSWERTATALY